MVIFLLPNQSPLKEAWHHVTQCLMTSEITVGLPIKLASGQNVNQYRLICNSCSWYVICAVKIIFTSYYFYFVILVSCHAEIQDAWNCILWRHRTIYLHRIYTKRLPINRFDWCFLGFPCRVIDDITILGAWYPYHTAAYKYFVLSPYRNTSVCNFNFNMALHVC